MGEARYHDISMIASMICFIDHALPTEGWISFARRGGADAFDEGFGVSFAGDFHGA